MYLVFAEFDNEVDSFEVLKNREKFYYVGMNQHFVDFYLREKLG
jgi:hypothetical protein